VTAPTVTSLLAGAVVQLRAAGVADPARDARLLLAHAMDCPAARLTLALHDPVHNDVVARFSNLVLARAARQPVAQIIGRRAFWGRDFIVTPDVLDPRPDTEAVIAAALDTHFSRVLDLGTGSGAIVLTLLAEQKDALGVGVDISAAALRVASQNAAQLAVQDRVTFLQSDWCASVTGWFDLIVANPPYITASEMADLAPEVREWEPHLALTPANDSDDTGLSAYERIVAEVSDHLAPNGWLMVEIGRAQGTAVAGMFHAIGLRQVAVLPDLDGRDRVVIGKAPPH
jgi:release factor glutamine methyltransferase